MAIPFKLTLVAVAKPLRIDQATASLTRPSGFARNDQMGPVRPVRKRIVDTRSPIIMISPVENQADITKAVQVQDDFGMTIVGFNTHSTGLRRSRVVSSGCRSTDDFGTTIVGFNTHSIGIPAQSDKDTKRDENKHFGYLLNYKFQSNEDCSSDEHFMDDGSFLFAPEDTEIHDLNPDFSVTQQHSLETCYLHLMKIAVETCCVTNLGLRPQRLNGAHPGLERSSLALQTVDTGFSIIMISPVENQVDITKVTVVQESQVQDAGARVDPYDHGISPYQIIENSDYRVSTGFRSLSDDFGTTVVGFNTHSTCIPAQSDKDTRKG
ncbi:hypothetical protein WN943_010951 [Citrus x changshan-huyou]